MKFSLMMFFAVFAITGTAYADKHAMDKTVSKTAVPGIGEETYIERKDVQESGWGTGKGDAVPKKYIGETEKNLQKRDIKSTNDKSIVINHEEQYSIKKGP